MAGSLRTTNYGLSKYAPGDITSWLVDFNGNMDKIDAQMKANENATTGTSGKLSALTQKLKAIESNVNAIEDDVEQLTTGTAVKTLTSSPSSNLTEMSANLYNFMDLFIGNFRFNFGNKTGDLLSTIDIGSNVNKLVPIILFTGNPFNLPSITSPTITDLVACGSIEYTLRGGEGASSNILYCYYNGTNTVGGMEIGITELVNSIVFNNGIVAFAIKKQ